LRFEFVVQEAPLFLGVFGERGLGRQRHGSNFERLESQALEETPNLRQSAVQAGLLLDGLLSVSDGAWWVLAEMFLQAEPMIVELATASLPGDTADGVQTALGELFEITSDGGAGDASQASDVEMGCVLPISQSGSGAGVLTRPVFAVWRRDVGDQASVPAAR
jgi:hypothetical protein